jgi:mRNA interferase YafQ
MALILLTTSAFERDLRRVRKQGKNLDKLEAVVDALQEGNRLPARCHPHPLRGNWVGHWDCHVEPIGCCFTRSRKVS